MDGVEVRRRGGGDGGGGSAVEAADAWSSYLLVGGVIGLCTVVHGVAAE
jgi:hypothetical protein